MFLVPFKGRNNSGVYNQNFLFKENNIYIMDNHRAALWCWYKHINSSQKTSLFHIDRHTDTLQSQLQTWIQHLPNITSISIDDYLAYTYKNSNGTFPLFRFDNYLSIFLERNKSKIDEFYFATHLEGDKPNFHSVKNINIWDIPENIDFWLSTKSNWIVNIDIDYFFYSINDKIYQLIDDNYIEKMIEKIKNQINKISVITIALSPEWTEGWISSERICSIICKELGIKFKLP